MFAGRLATITPTRIVIINAANKPRFVVRAIKKEDDRVRGSMHWLVLSELRCIRSRRTCPSELADRPQGPCQGASSKV